MFVYSPTIMFSITELRNVMIELCYLKFASMKEAEDLEMEGKDGDVAWMRMHSYDCIIHSMAEWIYLYV